MSLLHKPPTRSRTDLTSTRQNRIYYMMTTITGMGNEIEVETDTERNHSGTGSWISSRT